MKAKENLLDKYYKGETSLEEEKELRNFILSEEEGKAENNMFGYFRQEAEIPEDLEDSIFKVIEKKNKGGGSLKFRMYSYISAAAVIIVLLSVYLGFRNERNRQMENEFFVMEQALFRVSESIQPEEEQDMLVLWVDNNVEIIIN